MGTCQWISAAAESANFTSLPYSKCCSQVKGSVPRRWESGEQRGIEGNGLVTCFNLTNIEEAAEEFH